jgi:hypothetical protein
MPLVITSLNVFSSLAENISIDLFKAQTMAARRSNVPCVPLLPVLSYFLAGRLVSGMVTLIYTSIEGYVDSPTLNMTGIS